MTYENGQSSLQANGELSNQPESNVQVGSGETAPPIYFAGGFGYDQSRNDVVGRYVQSLGHDTIPALADADLRLADPRFTVTAGGLSRVVSRRQAMRLAGSGDIESLTSHYQLERAEELITALEERGHSGVRAIFQSADAINGLVVMDQRPDLVSSAVLAYPAGLIAQPRLFKASLGVFKSGWKSRLRADQNGTDNFEVLEDGTKIKGARAAGGLTIAASVALSDQGSLLHRVRSRAEAPGISLVLGIDDWMIRPERVVESLQSPNDVDFILITDKPHGINGRKDELQEWLTLFSSMEEMNAARPMGTRTTPPLTDRMRFFGAIPAKRREELLALATAVEARE